MPLGLGLLCWKPRVTGQESPRRTPVPYHSLHTFRSRPSDLWVHWVSCMTDHVLGLDTESGPAPSPRRPWPGSQRRRNGRCFPAGLITQCVLEDTNPASIWDRDHTACFNVQILNSGKSFQRVNGNGPSFYARIRPRPPPMRAFPVLQDLRGKNIRHEGPTSTVSKSVKERDKIENRTGMESARTKSDGALEQNKKAQGFSDD